MTQPPSSMPLATNSGRFPKQEDLRGSTDFLMVKSAPNTEYSKVNAYAANLQNGTLLVAVRKPSNTGMVTTALGDIAISANGDCLISLNPQGGTDGPSSALPGGTPTAWNSTGGNTGGTGGDGQVLRVMNLDGMGESCKVNLTGGAFSHLPQKIFVLAPGAELVAGTAPLSSRELRPNDGVTRRKAQMIDKHIALSRFSVESVFKGSDLIASLGRAESGSKESRVISDMSKMAAVLNQVHGSWGYEGAANK